MLELDVRIKAGDLYDYLLMHTYNGPSGLLGSCFGALLVVIGALKAEWIWVIAGGVLLVYLPWTLFLRSRKQALNPAFQKPLHYVLDEEGIMVSQDDVEQKQSWDSMVKAVSTSKSIIVYTTAVNATIFPKRELGDQKAALIQIISTHMPPSKVRIKE